MKQISIMTTKQENNLTTYRNKPIYLKQPTQLPHVPKERGSRKKLQA